MFALCRTLKRSQYEQINDEMTTLGKGILNKFIFSLTQSALIAKLS